MATTTQLTSSSISAKLVASFEGFRSTSNVKIASFAPLKQNSRCFSGLIVKAATVVTPKYTSVKPLSDRVLVKIKTAEEKTVGGILLPTTAQSNPQGGTEVQFDGSKHMILKEDDIVGTLETDDIKDLQPLNDRVLIKVITVGPGPLDDEGNRKSLSVSPGNTVLYSKYAGNDFKGADGSYYITLRASDLMAVLS